MGNSTENVCKCQAELVKYESVCSLEGTWTDEFDRLATVEDAKETHGYWKSKLSTWAIVGLNLQPECDKYGDFLMCRCQGELIFCQ